jgi:hypothetical protein
MIIDVHGGKSGVVTSNMVTEAVTFGADGRRSNGIDGSHFNQRPGRGKRVADQTDRLSSRRGSAVTDVTAGFIDAGAAGGCPERLQSGTARLAAGDGE